MWMDEETRELKERISALSVEELLNIIEVEASQYRKQAIDFAKVELLARGIQFQENRAAIPESTITSSKALPCSACGGTTRQGILFADRELTIVFSDKAEERFVEVYACSKCGKVQLIVDLETDVQR